MYNTPESIYFAALSEANYVSMPAVYGSTVVPGAVFKLATTSTQQGTVTKSVKMFVNDKVYASFNFSTLSYGRLTKQGFQSAKWKPFGQPLPETFARAIRKVDDPYIAAFYGVCTVVSRSV